jgi:acyl dehydratase
MNPTKLSAVEVGTELPPLAIGPISRTTLALFAGASGDHNPIHIDIDVARAAGLDDVFAHGMLSMAYLGRVLTTWVPQERILTYSVRFTAVTPVGGDPVCSGRVTQIEEADGRRLASVALTAQLTDGTTVLTGTARVDITGD